MFSVNTNNVYTNFTKPIKLAKPETAFVCLLYIQTMHKLYKMYTDVNWIIYAVVCFLYTKPQYSLLFEFLHPQ